MERNKRLFCCLACLLLTLLGARAVAAELSCLSGEGLAVAAKTVDGENCLFLSAHVSLSRLVLCFDGEETRVLSGDGDESLSATSGQPFDLTSLFSSEPEDGKYRLYQEKDGEKLPFATVMRSENHAALYLQSDDPVSQGREWLESQDARAAETTGSMRLVRPDGSLVYDGELRQLRGRGNTTWIWGDKKPYQIKLETKTDLLDSDDPDNRQRTWLLLADAFDATHLHNAMTLDLGKAMKFPATSEYRFVDLYYDGDYRGMYLLCEKVQVKSGRLEILDLTEVVEKAYPGVGDTERFPRVETTNLYGNPYRYVQNMDASFGLKGAYLLELDEYNYSRNDCYFRTSENWYKVHSPEYVSQADMELLSCFMQELTDTVGNGGVHPSNGKTVEDYVDLESMARFFLVQQFAKTADYWYTSTFFYIPAGEEKLYAGPLWDFDIAYAMRDTRPFEGGTDGYVAPYGWMWTMATLPCFQKEVVRLFNEEMLPLLEESILGEASGKESGLRSLEDYLLQIEASRRMNDEIWELGGHYNNINWDTLYETYEENVEYFRNYLTARTEWMKDDLSQWSWDGIRQVRTSLTYTTADVRQSSTFAVENRFSNCRLAQWSLEAGERVEEEPWHVRYRLSFTLEANEGSAFEPEVVLLVNGCEAATLQWSERTVEGEFFFDGPAFEPAVYDDVDYALVFNAAYYAHVNEEAYEECGDDPELLLEHYVDYGLTDGVSAVETFDLEWLLENDERMETYYSCDAYGCTMHYVEHAADEEMLALEAPVKPLAAENENTE